MGYKKFHPAKKYKWHTTPLYELQDMILKRRANEKDNIILITGARGDGKTTFTGKMLFRFEDFDPYESMIYNKEGMFKLIKKKNGFIWADEGVVNAAKGNVMTRANKMLFEVTTINRDNYNIVFFLMPFVEDFDSKILQYVSMWVHIDSRGLGALMLPSNKGIFGKRNWDLNSMRKIYDEFQKENQKTNHAPYWIYPNFRGYIKFGKLTKKQDEIIKEIKAKRKNENLDSEIQKEVEMEVKGFENYNRNFAKKLSEMIMKGEIRNMETFEMSCKEFKVEPAEIFKKSEAILKRNGFGKTIKQAFKQYEKEDTLINF